MQAAPGIILLAGIFVFLGVIVWQIAAQNNMHKSEHEAIKSTLNVKLTELRDGVKEIQTHRDFQAEKYAENIQRQDKAIEVISANTTTLTQLLQRFLAEHGRSSKEHEKAHDELLDKVDSINERLPSTPQNQVPVQVVQTPQYPQGQNFQGFVQTQPNPHAPVTNPSLQYQGGYRGT